MKIKGLLYRLKPPCPRCPYTLGQVHTVSIPCPQCRANGYRMFGWFRKNPSKNYLADESEE